MLIEVRGFHSHAPFFRSKILAIDHVVICHSFNVVGAILCAQKSCLNLGPSSEQNHKYFGAVFYEDSLSLYRFNVTLVFVRHQVDHTLVLCTT